MRGVVFLSLAVAACASARPAGPPADDDLPTRTPDRPPSELAERIIEAQGLHGDPNSFRIVEVNLRSADEARVRSALAVIEAMAASIYRKHRKPSGEDDLMGGIGELVNDVSWAIDGRFETAPCSLVFALEHAAGEFHDLLRYVPPSPPRSPDRGHRLAMPTIDCVMQSITDKVTACSAKHEIHGNAAVEIVADKQGAVTSAVTIGRFANTSTGDCVAAAIKALSFPPSDEVTKLTYKDY